ncbi:MAG: hypothetical protein AMXMBFR48_19410 [Ignavibacteriales bacterium]
MAKKNFFDDDDATREYFEPEDDSGGRGGYSRGGDDDDDRTRFGSDDDDYGGGRGRYEDDGGETVLTGGRSKAQILGLIVVKKGRRKNEKFDLTKNDIIIGRSPKCCDIILEDDEVSKIHCRIRKNPGTNEFLFFDCGSTNGTMVNGASATNIVLKSHDIITLGESVELVYIQV